MKGSVCLPEFKEIDTKCKLHGLWVTLMEKCIATNIEHVMTVFVIFSPMA